MEWYYVEDGRQIGPLKETDFNSLIREGKITPITPVWREGMKDWQAYGSLALPNTDASWVKCNECGCTVPEDESIRFNDFWICSACKPAFVQKLKEGVNVNAAFDYASFGMRFVARFVDGVILWIGEMAILVGLGASMALTLRNSMWNPQTPLFLLIYPLLFVLGIGYSVFFVGKYSATPGKMLLHMKIVTSDGGPMNYKKAFLRFLAEMVSALACYVGYLLAAFDEERRTLHDRICDTRVIRTE